MAYRSNRPIDDIMSFTTLIVFYTCKNILHIRALYRHPRDPKGQPFYSLFWKKIKWALSLKDLEHLTMLQNKNTVAGYLFTTHLSLNYYFVEQLLRLRTLGQLLEEKKVAVWQSGGSKTHSPFLLAPKQVPGWFT